jgi:hypothetical protein
MTRAKKAKRPLRNSAAGRLFVLELSAGCIHSMRPDSTDRKVIVGGCRMPDGIVRLN